ncbi:MAG: CbtA family protein [Rhodospirillales bacterium]|nr:CbtA family protein [Rhodospirillales bacterium]
MVRTLLVRGMLVGILAGLMAFAFAEIFGEPQVNLAIGFEEHIHQMAGEAPEPELVSRNVQSTVGLLTGMVVYSCALGGIFALIFSYVYGRIGRLSPRATAAVLAAAGFIAVILVPQLKYPANPPAIGNPETIGARTTLYFGMITLSVIAFVAALGTGRRLITRFGRWNATLISGGTYIVVMSIVMLVLPPVNEVPLGFSAVVFWKFRLASLGIEAVLWTAIGLAFGPIAERVLAGRSRDMARSRLAGSV